MSKEDQEAKIALAKKEGRGRDPSENQELAAGALS
jgi:hypothetical protein